jgi:hypothetical protein
MGISLGIAGDVNGDGEDEEDEAGHDDEFEFSYDDGFDYCTIVEQTMT